MPLAAGFILFAIGVGLLAGAIARDAGRGGGGASGGADLAQLQADLARTAAELASTRAALEQLKLDARTAVSTAARGIANVAAATGTDREPGAINTAAAATGMGREPGAINTAAAATGTGREPGGISTVTAATATARGQEDAFEAGRKAGEAAAEMQIAALKKILTEKQAALDDAAANLVARDAQLAAVKTDIEKLRSEVVAAAERVRRIEQSAETAQRDAEKRIKALQAEQGQALALFQRVTQAARMKPDETLRTLQQAVRDARLIRRGTELRDAIPNEAVRKLFDTQEALLTQLDMLDPTDLAEFQAFIQRVQAMDLGPEVAEALKASDGDPAVRAWLIESQLLLAGVQRAG
jgi:hypothetical protein